MQICSISLQLCAPAWRRVPMCGEGGVVRRGLETQLETQLKGGGCNV